MRKRFGVVLFLAVVFSLSVKAGGKIPFLFMPVPKAGVVLNLYTTVGEPGQCGYNGYTSYCEAYITSPPNMYCYNSVTLYGSCTVGVNCPAWATGNATNGATYNSCPN